MSLTRLMDEQVSMLMVPQVHTTICRLIGHSLMEPSATKPFLRILLPNRVNVLLLSLLRMKMEKKVYRGSSL